MNAKTKWSIAGGAVLLLVGAWAALGPRGMAVQVVAVQRTGIVQSVAATGRLNASARIEMGADVTAAVLEVRVREGDTVQAGQVLVRLQDGEARAAVQQAQAALAEARGRALQQSSVTAPVASQAVVQAQALFQTTEREFQRTRELVAKGFFSQQKLDDARRQIDTARSALASAKLQAAANQDSGVEPALAASRIAQAQAALEAATARLGRLQITAPVDAVVLARNVEPGSLAQPGRTLISLAAQGPSRIDAAVDEKNLRLLTLGMAARAVADAYVGQPFDAKLTYIAPVVDPQRGSVEVRLEVLSPPAFLKPDMTVSVELIGGARKDALVLPTGAVRDADRDAPWVLQVQDGQAVRVPVSLGLRGVGSTEILTGLNADDVVILQTEKAQAGDKVRALVPVPGAAAQKGMEVPSYVQR